MQQTGAQLLNITKNYGSIQACKEVCLDLEAGKVHAILGDNGAGKSTLLKILAGLERPDEGEIIINGKAYPELTPALARKIGISMVHQSFSLVEELTVSENIELATPRIKKRDLFASISRNDFARIFAGIFEGDIFPEKNGTSSGAPDSSRGFFDLNMNARVSDLDMGLRQQLEIMKSLTPLPQILIMDEPTAFLDEARIPEFKILIESLKEKGCCIILSSHQLGRIKDIVDSATFMDSGAAVDTVDNFEDLPYISNISKSRSNLASSISEMDEPVLRLEQLEALAQRHSTGFAGLDLTVYPSEIVVLTDQGMDEALDGRKTLLDLFLGQVKPVGGEMRIGEKIISPEIPGEIKNAGVAVIPEDREQSGCIGTMSVAENLFLLNPSVKRGNIFLNKKYMREKAMELILEYDIQPQEPEKLLNSLSGGNQQRVLLARELSSHPKLLVVGSLTEGLDITAAEDIRWNIQRTAAKGAGVLIIANDLEMIRLAHTRLLMSDISRTI